MKTIIILILISINVNSYSQSIKDIIISNNKKEEIHIFDLISCEDTTIIIFCSKTCKPCINELNYITQTKLYDKYNIIVISINNNKTLDEDIYFFNSKQYPFAIYFDNNETAKFFFIENDYIPKKHYLKRNDTYILAIPQNIIFRGNTYVKTITNIKKL